MHRFEGLDEVQMALQRLIERDPPLVIVLPRQPGTKESRYAQLLSGEVEAWQPPSGAVASDDAGATSSSERLGHLEQEVALLREEVAALKEKLSSLLKQFE